jgi:hypothetical protein
MNGVLKWDRVAISHPIRVPAVTLPNIVASPLSAEIPYRIRSTKTPLSDSAMGKPAGFKSAQLMDMADTG